MLRPHLGQCWRLQQSSCCPHRQLALFARPVLLPARFEVLLTGICFATTSSTSPLAS
jgi:hypothetical protein